MRYQAVFVVAVDRALCLDASGAGTESCKPTPNIHGGGTSVKRLAAFVIMAMISAGLALGTAAGPAVADGTETLGPPAGVTLASGTGVITAGVGTRFTQPAAFTFNVPGAVKQVLLYWSGHFNTSLGGSPDPTIDINNGGPNTSVTGTQIGGP